MKTLRLFVVVLACLVSLTIIVNFGLNWHEEREIAKIKQMKHDYVMEQVRLAHEARQGLGNAVEERNKAVDERHKKIDRLRREGWIVHTVIEGDSVYSVARQYKTFQHLVVSWNDLKSTVLQPGQLLKLKKLKFKAYEGIASWYGPGFHGQRMANGRIYDQNDVLFAHRHLPLGTIVRVTNLENGKSVVAKVEDRGPYTKENDKFTREIDLSLGAARLLRFVKKGLARVKIEPIG